jgi:hypothetical protein
VIIVHRRYLYCSTRPPGGWGSTVTLKLAGAGAQHQRPQQSKRGADRAGGMLGCQWTSESRQHWHRPPLASETPSRSCRNSGFLKNGGWESNLRLAGMVRGQFPLAMGYSRLIFAWGPGPLHTSISMRDTIARRTCTAAQLIRTEISQSWIEGPVG